METLQKENTITKSSNKSNKKTVKRVIQIGIIGVAILGIAYGMYSLFKEDDTTKEQLTDFVTLGSIQSTVTGSGVTKAKNATTLTLSSAGKAEQVLVSEGDFVNKDDLLYVISSPSALENLEVASENVVKRAENLKEYNDSMKELNDELDDIYEEQEENQEDRHIYTEFDGQLRNIQEYKVGDYISEGTQIAEFVDDSKLKISFYFSYAYEKMVYIGQKAQISVPAVMENITGTVSEINMVRRISNEGAKLFEAVVYCDNPGTLTEKLSVTAVLEGNNGVLIYPYENGVTEYIECLKLYADVSGKVEQVDLRNYMDVKKGTLLLTQEAGEYQDRIDSKKSEISSMQETIKDAQKQLTEAKTAEENAKKAISELSVYASISGTVLSCSISAGNEVDLGQVALSIADTSVMLVEAQIDERNVTYVKNGMSCLITQWGRNGEQTFEGTVQSVSLEGKYENGVSYFPAMIKVENADGSLMSGMYVDYSLVASQSDDCLLVPVQAVKYTEAGTCLFVRTEEQRTNIINAEEYKLDVPEGFVAILVEVGLSDSSRAEILSGANEGDEVFVQYLTNNGNSYPKGW